MRAITLTQPFATFAALGIKTIETRPYATDFRGPLAIYAAPDPTPAPDPYFQALLAENQYDFNHLPAGVVVATCLLAGCARIQPADCPCYPEYAFSDFRPGWYAWRLAGARILNPPVPANPPPAAVDGKGLWIWEQG